MNELDELLEMVKEKSYSLSGWSWTDMEVEVIEIEDLKRIINELKELAKTKCSELFKTPIAYNGLGSTDFWIDGYIHGSDRFKTIAYNAIVFAQLDEQYSKEELERELGCTEQELLDIADGDEAMIENLGLGE